MPRFVALRKSHVLNAQKIYFDMKSYVYQTSRNIDHDSLMSLQTDTVHLKKFEMFLKFLLYCVQC